MTQPIINISDVALQPRPASFVATGAAAERFDARMGFVAPPADDLPFVSDSMSALCVATHKADQQPLENYT